MANSKKKYDDDDGRVIADMSFAQSTPLFIPRFKKKSETDGEEKSEDNSEFELTGEERRAFIHGALGAALVIGTIFVAVGFLFIFILTRLH